MSTEDKGILRWVVIISGFTQHEGENHGCQRLWRNLHRELAGPDTAVLLVPWDHNMKHLAHRILHSSPMERLLTVLPYSWGAGKGFLELAMHTQIDSAVLCDPISFPLIGLPIIVPDSVGRVWWFRQRRNVPYSAGVIGKNVFEGIELPYSHEEIDDSPEWHRLSMDVATGKIDTYRFN